MERRYEDPVTRKTPELAPDSTRDQVVVEARNAITEHISDQGNIHNDEKLASVTFITEMRHKIIDREQAEGARQAQSRPEGDPAPEAPEADVIDMERYRHIAEARAAVEAAQPEPAP